MTEPTDVAVSTDAEPADELQQLRAENEDLRQQLQALRARADGEPEDAELLAEQRRINEGLRKELAAKALAEALRSAADEVGIDPNLAAAQADRFRCTVHDDGRIDLTPDPVETFRDLARSDPQFANPADTDRPNQQADPAAVNESDPVDLIAWLDRNPAKRYEFIRRHGRGRFFELLRTAKRRGYRGPGR